MTSNYLEIDRCRFCRGELEKIINLGKIPAVNFFPGQNTAVKLKKYPLDLTVCKNCELLQLSTVVNPSQLFKNYHYQTGASPILVRDLNLLARNCIKEFKLSGVSKILDIGCNDGAFLEQISQKGVQVVGIEPGREVSEVARKKGIDIVQDFFDLRLVQKLKQKYKGFDLITSLHNLANILDINDFFDGIKLLLKSDGVLVVEVADCAKMIKEGRFDSIYHEHYSYFTPKTLRNILGFHGFRILKSEKLSKQGGSIRVFAQHTKIARKIKFPEVRMEKYQKYAHKVEKVQLKLEKSFMKLKGNRVIGFGAPAKAVVIANLLKLDKGTIQFIVDSTEFKQNKLLPGTNIPVFSEDYLKGRRVDYVFIFAWNYKEEILKKLMEIKKLEKRFKFKAIIPFPKLKIIKV